MDNPTLILHTIHHERITEAQLVQAFSQMNPIEVVELRDAFQKAKPNFLKMARENCAIKT